MIKPLLLALTLSFSLIAFSGCSDSTSDGGSSANINIDTPNDGKTKKPKTDPEPELRPSAPREGNVTGLVTDALGNPLAGAIVKSGTRSTTTGTNGVYIIQLESNNSVSITADFFNFAENSKNVTVETNQTTNLDLTLAKVDTIVTFDTTAGVTVSIKGASVELPEGSYVLADGSTYTGEVTAKVAFNTVATDAGAAAFPGDFTGVQTDGSVTGILSYGFIDVVLEDSNGNPLQLGTGETAMLSFPIDASAVDTTKTIPLWYYDTEKGAWIEDGSATYDVATGRYIGTVSHFTTWNLDAKFDGATFEGCVMDENNNTLTTADLYISTLGWSKHVKNVDDNGTFKFINTPSDANITIFALANGLISEKLTFELLPGQDKVITPCLVVENDASQEFASISGKILINGEVPVTSVYVQIEVGNEWSSFRVEDNGTFSSSAILRGTATTIKLYIDTLDQPIKREFVLTTNDVNTNIGTIDIQTTVVHGCVTRFDNNSTFNTPENYINIDAPYYYNYNDFDEDGYYLVLERDFITHTLYAHTGSTMDEQALFGSLDFQANQERLDLTNNCIVLNEEVIISKPVTVSITTTQPDTYVDVLYTQETDYLYPDSWGEAIINEGNSTATFTITENGVYYISQLSNSRNNDDYDGSISITLDGKTHTVIVPANATSYEGWVGFAIEVYQGTYKIIEINSSFENGECGRGECS